MNLQTPDAAEQDFLTALIEADVGALERLLADDFIVIDVITGSEIPKSTLLDVIRGGQLRFEEIDRVEFRVRVYGATAVVTGRTLMRGSFAGQSFGTNSRYTHVFVEEGGHWRIVAAQGTQISLSPRDSS